MSPDPTSAEPVPVIPGYEILDVLAQVEAGAVYRARDLAIGHDVAVKVPSPRSATPHACRRFVDVVRIVGQLQLHPGIPPVFSLGELPDGRPFVVTKLIRGRTLSDIFEENRSDPSSELSRLLAVFEQVCQTVAYAHFRRVIHRDLKPWNVMIGPFGEVLVMDWGLAKVLPPAADGGGAPAEVPGGEPVRTARAEGGESQAGTVMGTPAYMSPEQAIGAVDQIDERSDVFGLGGILCHLLTGAPPFRGESLGDALRQAAAGDVGDAFARLAACGADAELVALCRQCLSPNPADRPADAGAVARAISEYRTAASDPARWAEVNRVRVEEQRKRRRVQLVLAAAVGLLIAGTAFGWWREQQQRLRESEERQMRVDEENRRLGSEWPGK